MPHWRRNGRAALAAAALAAVAVPGGATAASGKDEAFIAPGLIAAADQHPGRKVAIIIQSSRGTAAAERAVEHGGGLVRRQLRLVGAVAAEVPAARLRALARVSDVVAITEDAPVTLAAASGTYDGNWRFVAGVSTIAARNAPAIAVVDSGIDASRSDFQGRVVTEVNMTTLTPNAPGDGRGHGTFVAGIAAGAGRAHPGVEPGADLVSIDVMDDRGMAMTSDVIAAADWIYRNKERYGIRVANFSLHSSLTSSFMFDPLDKAVEKLWFSGVVVVAAAGNYAVDGQASGVLYAPANDPFVITVGANDINGSRIGGDDAAAPWSAYGYTLDGFAKPEVAAPGRYMVGAVPPGSTMASERPDRIVGLGYMWMSGTSFAAPVVSGAAAHILATHPDWMPDEVKGALMLATSATPRAASLSTGVGEIHAVRARNVVDPPNPNLALVRFLVADPAGGPGPVFDAASWANVAGADASWANASWANASWANASWSAASWATASWATASWATASWASSSPEAASWANASWAAASWAGASWATAGWIE